MLTSTSMKWTSLIHVFLLLSCIAVIFPQVNALNNTKLLTVKKEKELNDTITMVKEFIANQTMDDCTKKIAGLVGWLPERGKMDTEGIYSRFVQAYHYSWSSIQIWTFARSEFIQERKTMLSIREMQREWEKLRAHENTCSEARNLSKSKGLSIHAEAEVKVQLEDCLSDHAILEVKSGEFALNLLKLTHRALTLVMRAFIFSSDDDPTIFENRYLYTPFVVNLFTRMYTETTLFEEEIKERLDNTFPEYIAKQRSEGREEEANELEAKLVEIKDRLSNTYPYTLLYFDGDLDKLDSVRWDDPKNSNGYKNFAQYMESFYYGRHFFNNTADSEYSYSELALIWEANIDTFIMDYNAGLYDAYWKRVETVDRWWLKVDNVPPENASTTNGNGILVGDGMWDWDLTGNGIQNMRLAWDLMDAVLEEIKCYMKETYYFHLRDEAIRRTQLNLTKGALFSGISRTMFAGCRIENDSDLVTQYCTRENHEICTPIGALHKLQRPESIFHGGLSVMKPHWIYKYDESSKKCVGRRDYVLQMNQCRCGFRLDCGNDLGVNITCQLQNNDLLRSQCRGGVGYPCKTLPLAPGKHHQTCKSGYCDMKTNSCEDKPPTLVKNGGCLLCVEGLFMYGSLSAFLLFLKNWIFYLD